VTDYGLATLVQCTDLERLILKGTLVTDRGMRHLAELRSLRELNLSGTLMTDEGLQAICRTASIERLVLDHTAVSDEGLSSLSKARGLRSLSLMHCRITDYGLDKLIELPSLAELCLIGTDVSTESIVSLHQNNKDCDIQHTIGEAIDLLDPINVERDAVHGDWSKEDASLVSPAKTRLARLQLPVVPPDEYILKATISRQSTTDVFCFGISSSDRQFCVAIDAFPSLQGRSGLSLVDGESADDNATSRPGRLLVSSDPTDVVITVQESHISAAVDGKLIVDWEGNFKRLALNPCWEVPRQDSLFLGTECPYAVGRLSLTPISGSARFLEDPAAASSAKKESTPEKSSQ